MIRLQEDTCGRDFNLESGYHGSSVLRVGADSDGPKRSRLRGGGGLGHMLSSPLRALTARSPAATVNMWVPGGRKDASKGKPHCLRIQGHSICSGNKDIFNLSQGRTLWYRVRNMYVEILIYSLAASEVVNVISSGTARYGKFIGTVSVILEIYWSYNSTGNCPIRPRNFFYNDLLLNSYTKITSFLCHIYLHAYWYHYITYPFFLLNTNVILKPW